MMNEMQAFMDVDIKMGSAPQMFFDSDDGGSSTASSGIDAMDMFIPDMRSTQTSAVHPHQKANNVESIFAFSAPPMHGSVPQGRSRGFSLVNPLERRRVKVTHPKSPVHRANIAPISPHASATIATATLESAPALSTQGSSVSVGSQLSQAPHASSLASQAQRGVLNNDQIKSLWRAHKMNGTIPTLPNGREISLCQLISAVNKCGGFHHVRSQKRWKSILSMVCPGMSLDKSSVNRMKRFYSKFILPWENLGFIPSVPPRMQRRNSAPVFHMSPPSTYRAQPAPMPMPMSVRTSAQSSKPQAAIAKHVTATPAVTVKQSPARSTLVRRSSHPSIIHFKPTEVRIKAWRQPHEISESLRLHVQQYLGHRMYVLARQDSEDPLEKRFSVLDRGKIFTVVIGRLHQCSCLEDINSALCHDENHGALCRHMCFALHRILKVPLSSPYVYQSALITAELRKVFSAASSSGTSDPHPLRLSQLSNVVMKGADAVFSLGSTDADMLSTSKPKKEDCPICYESLGTEPLVRCESKCRASFHESCFNRWSDHYGKDPMCPSCHAPWKRKVHSPILPMNFGNMSPMTTMSAMSPMTGDVDMEMDFGGSDAYGDAAYFSPLTEMDALPQGTF